MSGLRVSALLPFTAALILSACGGEEPNNPTEIKRSSLTVAADPPGHTFQDSVDVVLTSGGGADIFYTLDGRSPLGSDGTLYQGPIRLDHNVLLTFVAKVGDLWSEQGSELYERQVDTVAPKLQARVLTVDDDNVVFSARRGEDGPMRQSVRLKSVGLQQVHLEGIYVDANPDSWSFWQDGIFEIESPEVIPEYLSPGESIDLVVTYTPTETIRTAMIFVVSDNQRTSDGTVRVNLTGRIWDW